MARKPTNFGPTKEMQFHHQRVEVAGRNVWHFDGKYRPTWSAVRIYDLYGDINDPEGYCTAIRAFLDSRGLQGIPMEQGR